MDQLDKAQQTADKYHSAVERQEVEQQTLSVLIDIARSLRILAGIPDIGRLANFAGHEEP